MLKIFSKNYRRSECMMIFMYRYKSHYASLGLDSNATPDEIKSAYYKLSMKYHPDKNKGSAESAEKFREISAAYEVLGNLSKKRIYDESQNYRYSESEWRNQHYSPRSTQFKERSKPRTGRSEYYNYDEHYKQHYEAYERQRQADYEYFKRRWEADFRRRHPFREKPDWSEGQKQREYQSFKWKIELGSKRFIFYLSAWIIIFLLTLPIVEPPLDKPSHVTKPIYYKIKHEEEKPSQE